MHYRGLAPLFPPECIRLAHREVRVPALTPCRAHALPRSRLAALCLFLQLMRDVEFFAGAADRAAIRGFRRIDAFAVLGLGAGFSGGEVCGSFRIDALALRAGHARFRASLNPTPPLTSTASPRPPRSR